MTPKSTAKRKISRWDLLKVFFLSFFMQSVWNFRSLISVGFSICLFPVLNKVCPTVEAKRDFFRRHLKFFNAHPYFASFALGVSIRLEELAAEGEAEAAHILDQMKNLLISPLGAVGDRLFWATIKPASLIFGMVSVLLIPGIPGKIAVLVLTFLIYNVPHFYYRYNGILEGYKYGLDVYKYVSQERFEKLRRVYSHLMLYSIVALIIVYSWVLFSVKPGLMLVFWAAVPYTLILNLLTRNFYLISLASFIFFITVGILFF